MSCWASNKFRVFVLNDTSVKNPDLHTYVAANRIKA